MILGAADSRRQPVFIEYVWRMTCNMSAIDLSYLMSEKYEKVFSILPMTLGDTSDLINLMPSCRILITGLTCARRSK